MIIQLYLFPVLCPRKSRDETWSLESRPIQVSPDNPPVRANWETTVCSAWLEISTIEAPRSMQNWDGNRS